MSDLGDASQREARGGRTAGGVALLTPSGWGNLGDAAIVDSAVQAVRRRLPGAPIVGLTLNPVDTAKRHGIPAFTCSGFTFGKYLVNEQVPSASPAHDGYASSLPDEETGAPGPRRRGIAAGALGRLARTAPGFRHAWQAARMLQADIVHRRLVAETVKGLDFIVVAGGGQLDDFWGGTFGHPYVLWRWAQQARTSRSRFVVLSVGTGTLVTPLARAFVRKALAAADYRSFRDEGSRALMADPRLSADPIVPDLAYGLPMDSWRAARRLSGPSSVVGVSPIAYCDPRVWPTADLERYRSYGSRLASLVASLVEAGHDVVLFGTDGPDNASIADLQQELARRLPEAARGRVRERLLESHEQLFRELATVRVVVASRLHGVLLSHLMGVPTLAISYERKVRTLMKTMSHERYCLEIDDFDPAAALALTSELLARGTSISEDIVRWTEGFRREVDAQFDHVFG